MNLSILIRIFSINGVFFGLVCIGVQAGALTLFLLSYKDDYISNAGPSDLLGCGIWAGAIAIITGGVGIAASYRHSKALSISTAILAIFAVGSAATTAAFAGNSAIQAYVGYPDFEDPTVYCFSNLATCDIWLALEWVLFGVSIVSFVNSFILFCSSIASACSHKTH